MSKRQRESEEFAAYRIANSTGQVKPLIASYTVVPTVGTKTCKFLCVAQCPSEHYPQWALLNDECLDIAVSELFRALPPCFHHKSGKRYSACLSRVQIDSDTLVYMPNSWAPDSCVSSAQGIQMLIKYAWAEKVQRKRRTMIMFTDELEHPIVGGSIGATVVLGCWICLFKPELEILGPEHLVVSGGFMVNGAPMSMTETIVREKLAVVKSCGLVEPIFLYVPRAELPRNTSVTIVSSFLELVKQFSEFYKRFAAADGQAETV